MAAPRVVSVNVGGPAELNWHGRVVRSSIWKHPVAGPVQATGINLAGDSQADRKVHGGPDKAIYAYATEDYAWWQEQLGKELELASFGENLTTGGIDLTEALIGERWRVGTCVLEVAQHRTPCYKLGIRLGDDTIPDRFLQAGRPGAYLRIAEEGKLSAGEDIEVIYRPKNSLSVGAVATIIASAPERAAELLEIPALAASRQAWARSTLARMGLTLEGAS
ncbi:MAG: MOSC domain-containing protein [Acidimicrobiales bacterium]